MDTVAGARLTGAVRFAKVTLQGFRNLSLVEVELAGRHTFLGGANAQGKTNFLEALGYVTALRSFRGAETRALIGLGQPQAGLGFGLEHETLGASRVVITLTPAGREVQWEQGKVTKLADFIGRFPTVAFSSHDNQFLRGAPSLRRRWLDLTLAAMDPAYLTALQRYTRAVAERNMLLKQGGRDLGAIEAFEHELAIHAAALVNARTNGVTALGAHFHAAHARLVPEGESAGLLYAPDTGAVSAQDHAELQAKNRPRDTLMKSTERGPHRDDVDLLLNGRPARQFASEGQQRCLVIALRLAQAAYFKAQGGITPVLLCDDVLGELDPSRRALFWGMLDPATAGQVIATGTTWPDAPGWQRMRVQEGTVKEQRS